MHVGCLSGKAARAWTRCVLATSVAALAAGTSAADPTDDVYMDRGACPGEGCTYGERWIAVEPVTLYASPSETSAVVADLEVDEEVETVTGEVHTQPGRLVVKEARGGFAPGDEILLYTYLGEGWWQARHRGKLQRTDVGFGPYGRRCRSRDDDRCWVFVDRLWKHQWWVELRRASGQKGWALDSRALRKPSAH